MNSHSLLPRTPLIEQGQVDAVAVVRHWLQNTESMLFSNTVIEGSIFAILFHEDSWWRDHLALQWNLRTIRGRDSIAGFISERQKDAQLSHFRLRTEGPYLPLLESPRPDLQWLRCIFTFETRFGLGIGVVRLTQDVTTRVWKAYTVYTALQELKQFRELSGHRRPEGNVHSLPGGKGEGTWAEKREMEVSFNHEQPIVLVVGGGQAGLDVAARLRAYAISCLVVERNLRIGDNWRNRYKVCFPIPSFRSKGYPLIQLLHQTLTTHDPVVTCHMPYLPFPKTWPQFTPKDKLADWLEAYASIMELNVWTNASVVGGKYDEKKGVWSIEIEKKVNSETIASRVIVHPLHVVWATGHSGEPKVPLFPGQDKFEGVVYHASKHHDASDYDVKGKKVIVVGTGNSGHDIAQNFYINGAHVTMVQRSATYVCTQEKGLFMLHEGLKDEDCPSIEDADLIGESLPILIQLKLADYLTEEIKKKEECTITGLAKAGFQLDKTPLWTKYLTKGGGYYIDIGCSQLIIDGKIKIKHSPNGIREFRKEELVLADGTSLPADIVVLATGYDNMRSTVRRVLGDEIADCLHDIWDLDSEGELNALWGSNATAHVAPRPVPASQMIHAT
ncbi:hypothetical protein KEM54_006361 [Ascosphaera aggregata]|nr:hypothetical protein KEM54_006361 [Ascosphaera aggregata]